jgi:hypothetical protein
MQRQAMVFFGGKKKPSSAGLWDGEMKSGSGGGDAMAPVNHLSLQLSLKGLDLAEHREAAGRTTHLAFQLVEDLMQPLGSGPEGRILLSFGGVHVHGGSRASWTT